MNYNIDDTTHEATLQGKNLVIDGRSRSIKVISAGRRQMQFILDGTYYEAAYVGESRGVLEMEINGIPVTVSVNTGLDDIVYKNTGGARAASSDSALLSQVPGKVVSVAVSSGDAVSDGDTICVLESMKMQVSVKARRGGTVKSVRAKVGSSIAKGDLIAEIE